jgi:hypothetical protein
VGNHHQNQQSQQQPQAQYEMTGDKTILTDSAAPYNTANSANGYNYNSTTNNNVSSPSTHPATTTVEPNTINSEQNNIEYQEKVQALHACK